MAIVTIGWNPESPAGSDNINNGDDVITAFKQGLAQRMLNGGHGWPANGTGPTTATTDGLHACGVNATALGTELAGEFTIYAANKSTVVAVFRDNTAATPSELHLGANKLRAATVEASSLIKPSTDAAVDLGVTATNRFRDLFLSRNASIGGTLAVTGVATFTVTPVFSGGLSATTLTSTTQLAVEGGSRTSQTAVLTAGATLTTANRVVFCNVAAGGFTITLPAASTVAGLEYWVCIHSLANGSANTVLVAPNGTDNIDSFGAGINYTLKRSVSGSPYLIHMVSDGTSRWELISVTKVA